MEERIVSLMLDKDVYRSVQEFCFKKNLKIKHFIREAIIEALFSRGVKKCTKEK